MNCKDFTMRSPYIKVGQGQPSKNHLLSTGWVKWSRYPPSKSKLHVLFGTTKRVKPNRKRVLEPNSSFGQLLVERVLWAMGNQQCKRCFFWGFCGCRVWWKNVWLHDGLTYIQPMKYGYYLVGGHWNHGFLWLSILIGNFIIPTDELHHFSEG